MTPTNHPAPKSEREAIARMLKEQGFTSRDGTVINGGTYGVIDAILSRRMGAEPVAWREALALCEDVLRVVQQTYKCPDSPIINRARAAAITVLSASPPAPALDARRGEALPDDIRALGWSVAVHNDYHLDGVPHTFWLFTKDGCAIKGEGFTDASALNAVRCAIRADRGK